MWSVLQYRSIGTQVKQNRASKPDRHHAEISPLLPKTAHHHVRECIQPRLNDRSLALRSEITDTRQTIQQEEDYNSSDNNDGQYIIKLTSDNDPFAPRNWSLFARSKNIAILALLIGSQAWSGAADSVANTLASEEFGVSKAVMNLSTAIYLFGMGSGCLVVGPLSESVGRNPVYLTATAGYLFCVLGTALVRRFGAYIVFRYLIGVFCSATLGINGASVKDQFRPVKMAFVFPIIAWANVVPPVLAPIAGGWILDNPNLNWRYLNWVTLVISGFAFLFALLFLPETNLPVLLDWKAEQIRRVTKDDRYVSEHAEESSFVDQLKEVLPKSMRFVREPVIAILGAYLMLLYILLFTFLSGFEYVFKNTYELSNGLYGSCFAAIATGGTTFTLMAPKLYQWARDHTEHVHGARVEPEFRLWPAMLTAPLLPLSLFWLGWTDYPAITIWSGLAACFCFGIVLIAMYVSSYKYIMDSYGGNASTALASITMMRYIVAGVVVMVARPMFTTLNTHWTLTLLGAIATFLTPGPYLLHRYGKKLRESSEYAEDNEAYEN